MLCNDSENIPARASENRLSETQGAESAPDSRILGAAGTPWPGLGADALHGVAGEVVHLLQPISEADPAALLLHLLVGFGNMIGRRPHFLVEGARHGTNLFVAVVGATSLARKGTSFHRLAPIFHAVDSDWADGRVMSGLVSGAGLVYHVRDAVSKPTRVSNNPPRFEIVERDPGIRDKRLLDFEPEFARVLDAVKQSGDTLTTVQRAWETGELRTLARKDPLRATGAHISLLGHITTEELGRKLNRDLIMNGFANRFLWICARRSRFCPRAASLRPASWNVSSRASGAQWGSAAQQTAWNSTMRPALFGTASTPPSLNLIPACSVPLPRAGRPRPSAWPAFTLCLTARRPSMWNT